MQYGNMGLPPYTVLPVFIQSLPLEIMHQIVQLLDPISLIFLSQTSRSFRRLIQPGRIEQIEYLLALECLEKNGFGKPVLRVNRFGYMVPLFSDEDAWESNRWACTSCMRLLSHVHFNNHSLLRVRNRKPLPNTMTLTSWVPSLHGKNWGAELYYHTRRKTRFNTRATLFRKPEEVWGANRCWRRCNECLFQRGQLRPQPREVDFAFVGGTDTTPIQKTRFLSFPTMLDRYFPGLFSLLEYPRPSVDMWTNLFRRNHAREEYWALFMIRCSRCEKWQEMRSFRFGSVISNWSPVHIGDGEIIFPINFSSDNQTIQLDDQICNLCFMGERGEQKLAQELQDWVLALITLQRLSTERKLCDPLVLLPQHTEMTAKYGSQVEHITRDALAMNGRELQHLSRAEVARLKQSHRETLELWEALRGEDDRLANEMEENEDFWSWLYFFDDAEAHWLWLVAIQEELRHESHVLVNWAISRDGAALR